MVQDEIKEKEQTILEIVSRLDMHDEEISQRIKSDEYQSLLKGAFRNWSGAESEDKRILVRNILSNAAASRATIDEVVKLFIEWIGTYSEFHFEVIGQIYNNSGITRGQIWRNLSKGEAREDSAEADLYKLLFRDLSTGGIIRQFRETDYYGNFIKKPPQKRSKGSGSRAMKSAFDDEEEYELTALGRQFIHYAMTDLPVKISYSPSGGE